MWRPIARICRSKSPRRARGESLLPWPWRPPAAVHSHSRVRCVHSSKKRIKIFGDFFAQVCSLVRIEHFRDAHVLNACTQVARLFPSLAHYGPHYGTRRASEAYASVMRCRCSFELFTAALDGPRPSASTTHVRDPDPRIRRSRHDTSAGTASRAGAGGGVVPDAPPPATHNKISGARAPPTRIHDFSLPVLRICMPHPPTTTTH